MIVSDRTLPNPTHEDVAYGPHERNVLDLWQAPSDRPAPLLVVIHGGGFRGGDKRSFAAREQDLILSCLGAGISVAAINYRLSHHAPYPAPMLDSARAVQFLRARAADWRIDPQRFAATGSSAGAGISLWLGFHDDLADPASSDPVATQSTRLRCMLVRNGQSSYDIRFIKRLIPGSAWRHPALVQLFQLSEDHLLDPPPEKVRLLEDSSALTHLTSGDPPVYMTYRQENVPLPPDAGEGLGIHHPTFGALLKEPMDALGIECTVRCGASAQDSRAELAFLERHLA